MRRIQIAGRFLAGYLAFWGLTVLALRMVPIPEPLFAPEYGTLVADRRGETLRVF